MNLKKAESQHCFFFFIITINVLLILQVRDNFFFLREKHITGPFEGFLRSSRLFWVLEAQEKSIKSLGQDGHADKDSDSDIRHKNVYFC